MQVKNREAFGNLGVWGCWECGRMEEKAKEVRHAARVPSPGLLNLKMSGAAPAESQSADARRAAKESRDDGSGTGFHKAACIAPFASIAEPAICPLSLMA